MNKLLEIKIEKFQSKIDISIDSESSIANIDIAFKDLCIELRSAKEQFDLSRSENGYCEVSVLNCNSLFEKDLELLSKEELIARVGYYAENILNQKEFLQRTPIFRSLEKCQAELNTVYEKINVNSSKESILSLHGREIEFYNNQLFYNMFPSRKVEIIQTGFSYEELRIIIKDIYAQVGKKYSFIYKVDFDTLIFT